MRTIPYTLIRKENFIFVIGNKWKFFMKITCRLLIVMMSFFLSFPVTSEEDKITEYELNKKLLSFSDNYQESIAEITDKFIAEGINPTARMLYQTVKVFYVNSAIDIAIESDAVNQLLDMIVMLRLQLLVWRNGGHETLSTKDQARRMSVQLEKLEKQLHELATRVFSQADINSILLLAEKWKKENPDREYVAFVRFQDFSDSEDKAKIEQITSKGGLFSLISEANVEIEETRFAIERAMFLANRMPIMIEWQAELFLYKTLSTDEIIQTLDQTRQLNELIELVSLQIDKFPKEIQSLFDKNSKSIETISSNIARTSENLKIISGQLSPLFLTQDSNENSEIDMKQIKLIVEDALATTKELVAITENLNKFNYDSEVANTLSGLVTEQLTQVDNMLAKRMADLDSRLINHRELIFDRIFILLMSFCFLFPAVFFTGYLLTRRHIIKYGKHIENQ